MEPETRRASIAQHLAAAGAAHGEYEMTALHGEYDQQWAEWYAHFLLSNGWNELFVQEWTGEALTAALREGDKAHRANAPQEKWNEYYAGDLVKVE